MFLDQVATIQGLSGTGSLRIAAALIERYFPGSKVLISSPTWGTYIVLWINLVESHNTDFCSYVLQEIIRTFSMMPGCLGLNIDIMIPKQLAWILLG